MRRLTRRIGLFGGPAAVMSSSGVIKKPSVQASNPTPADAEAEKPTTQEATPPKRKNWIRRLFGSDDEA
jgi:hypothetical protein